MTRFSGTLLAEESFHRWEEERKAKRNKYWQMLRSAKNDFLKLTDQASIEYDIGEGAFYYYLQQNYGLKVELIDGKISGEYTIVDDKKYTIFLLKFGS